ncbi:retrograde regulation protein [Plectosphaerella plurivora]|uniref:Retrograde regulation protein n=1 Tax=Plectosphaerella plurivora TaxID=936078 RepID=A0A9P9A5X9_9PEZI|nr:retrograde regulation protein [Plectosphaerella plurivora]
MARILPTILQYRSGLSLYDAQFDPETGEKIPLPQKVIDSVCSLLRRFLVICTDFEVSKKNIHIVATEATRAAKNSADLLAAVKKETGLDIELLKKEDEGHIGALGVASGFLGMDGLVMDLGGGSTQITWIISQDGNVRISPRGSFSFPYGAAALTKTIEDLKKDKNKEEAHQAVEDFRKEMVSQFRSAYEHLEVPADLIEKAKQQGGFRIYLSGGGFRGWGYLLLHLNQTHGHHYPISVINGFTVGREQFEDTEKLKEVAKAAKDVFRVSDRRRAQVPAVAFLVSVVAEAIPHGIREAHFCQGGVREGYLFRSLSVSVRRRAPLEVATQRFAPGSRIHLQKLLEDAIPKANGLRQFPADFGTHVIDSFCNIMYFHMFMSKETASTSALYSTSTGIMSTIHGVSHQDRARLAIMLQARYRGEMPPRETDFRDALRSILTPEDVWWAQYLGRVGYLITCLYPAGRVDPAKPKVLFTADWSDSLGKSKSKPGIVLTVSLQKVRKDPAHFKESLGANVKVVEKAGKHHNWATNHQDTSRLGAKDEDTKGKTPPWGMKVKVRVVTEGIL